MGWRGWTKPAKRVKRYRIMSGDLYVRALYDEGRFSGTYRKTEDLLDSTIFVSQREALEFVVAFENRHPEHLRDKVRRRENFVVVEFNEEKV